jgi:quercetin dioxygenase-like cupin family protein
MKILPILSATLLIVGSSLALHAAQQPSVKRTDLIRHDLVAPGREVIQVRVDFPEGVAFPPHSHPGEEIAYVIEGVLEYRIAGEPPVILKAAVHTARNAGDGNAAELATYVVEKGKPLLMLDEKAPID